VTEKSEGKESGLVVKKILKWSLKEYDWKICQLNVSGYGRGQWRDFVNTIMSFRGPFFLFCYSPNLGLGLPP
jgi:hypothetical protein